MATIDNLATPSPTPVRLQLDGVTYDATVQEGRITSMTPVTDTTGSPQPSPDSGYLKPQTPEQIENERAAFSDKIDKKLLRDLQSVMMENALKRTARFRQRGTLDLKSLPRTQTNSPSVWEQTVPGRQMEYDILLLIDESGSMAGSKIALARNIAHSLVATMGELPGVRTAVLGFSDSMYEHKRFDNAYKHQLDKIVARDSNPDYAAIYTALQYMVENGNPKASKHILWLSDGRPCGSDKVWYFDRLDGMTDRVDVGGRYYDAIAPMHRLIRKAESEHGIHSYGVGIFQGGQQVPEHRVASSLAAAKRMVVDYLRTVTEATPM